MTLKKKEKEKTPMRLELFKLAGDTVNVLKGHTSHK